MSKNRIDENVMKYIIKLFFPNLEKEILSDPEIQRNLRHMSRTAAEFNELADKLERLTGKDFSDIKFKRK